MKGLVLSGGKGTRLRPFTYTGAKQLIPVANRPVLFHGIESLVAAGVTEIGVVTGDTAAEVRGALGDGESFGCRFTFIQQDEPLGIAHAVKLGQQFLGDDPFVLFLGDNFLRGGILPYVEAFRAGNADAQLLLKRVPNPSELGVAVLDEKARPVRLVEKPAEPPSDLALVGIYMFGPRIFEAIDATRPSRRGELEITDAVQSLMDRRGDVRAEIVTEPWIDTGKPEDMLTANRLLLETLTACVDGASVAGSELRGAVVLQAGARVVNSTISGPAIIGEETEVIDCVIGPYTSIYHHCQLGQAEIEDSIMLERSALESPGTRIAGSLIGRDVRVRGSGARGGSLRLSLGDHSRVELS